MINLAFRADMRNHVRTRLDCWTIITKEQDQIDN